MGNKKILITGASGFIGMPVVRGLAGRGEYEIYAVSSGRREVCFPDGVNPVTADLLDRKQSRKLIGEIRPDIMLHMAWDLSSPGYLKSHGNLIWLEESLFLLRLFIESGGKYFSFAGSCSEYGTFRGFSEKDALPALTLYGQCKNAFHKAAISACELSKVKYVNLRIFTVLGKGMPILAATTAAVAAFASGERFTCKSPYNIWDFIGIDDVAGAVCAILAGQYTGVVNIGSGVPRMMGDVYKMIAKKMNAEHLLSLDYNNKNKEILVANTDVLSNVIGYTCKTDLEKALEDMIEDIKYRARNDGNR